MGLPLRLANARHLPLPGEARDFLRRRHTTEGRETFWSSAPYEEARDFWKG